MFGWVEEIMTWLEGVMLMARSDPMREGGRNDG